MPANVYECLFMLDTTKVAGDLPTTVQQIHTILERHHAEILASRPWDERRLLYPIKGQKKALYYLNYFKVEAKELVGIERDVALNETILRSMVLKIEPKLVDTMLALARDEHALALQAVVDDGTDYDNMGGGDRRGGGRDRHGDRDRGERKPAEAAAAKE
jgi:small subunit ribosomal protein S6